MVWASEEGCLEMACTPTIVAVEDLLKPTKCAVTEAKQTASSNASKKRKSPPQCCSGCETCLVNVTTRIIIEVARQCSQGVDPPREKLAELYLLSWELTVYVWFVEALGSRAARGYFPGKDFVVEAQ